MEHRRVLIEVVEHQRIQADERLAANEVIEIDPQAQLLGAAAGTSSRPDGHVGDHRVAPLQIGRVVGVLVVGGSKDLEIARVHAKEHVVEHLAREEVRSRLGRGWNAAQHQEGVKGQEATKVHRNS